MFCYGIILIQSLIKYNFKNLITACTRLHDSDPQNGKISLPWEGNTPLPHPPPDRSLRSLAFVLKIFSVFFLKSEIIPPPPPPHFSRPVYDTAFRVPRPSGTASSGSDPPPPPGIFRIFWRDRSVVVPNLKSSSTFTPITGCVREKRR